MASEFDLSQFGGTLVGTTEKKWMFGWRDPGMRSAEENRREAAMVATMQALLPDRADQIKEMTDAEQAMFRPRTSSLFIPKNRFSGAAQLPLYTDNDTRVFLWDQVRPWNPQLLYVRQITGSCFPAGAPVRMGDGTEKRIEDVREGDTVIGHSGAPRKVVRRFNRQYTGDLYTYQAAGTGFKISLTADHEVRVVRPGDGWRERTGPQWIRADELTVKDRVLVQHHRKEVDEVVEIDAAAVIGEDAIDMTDLMSGKDGPYRRARVIRKAIREKGINVEGTIRLKKARHEGGMIRRIAVTPTFGRLLGIYLAEGGINAGRVVFTFNAAEAETLAAETITLLRGVFGVEGELRTESEHGRCCVRVSNYTLAAFLSSLVPDKCLEKRVPGFVFSTAAEVRKAVVCGWVAGDGHYASKSRKGRKKPGLRIQGVTASPGLARDMTVLGLSSGYRVAANRRPPRGRSKEAFDLYLGGPQASLDIAESKGLQPQVITRGVKDSNRTEHGYARKIRTIESTHVKNLTVYCLEVEEDHSFLVNDVVHHNCVGAGAGNMLITRQGLDKFFLGNQENPVFPFWLIAYGKSRQYLGLNDHDDGSSGTTMAKALGADGFDDANSALYAKYMYNTDDNLSWGEKVESLFAYGKGIPQEILAVSRQHTAGLAKQVTSFDEAVDHIRVQRRPLTIASDVGYQMNPKTAGSRFPVLLNHYADTWNHQMSCFSADTKVSLLDGTEREIGQLAKEGKSVWIYAYDPKKKRVVPKKATVNKTRDYVLGGLVRVTLSNGEKIDCTPDHKFMLRDGSWREAGDLKPDTSLMPLHRRLTDKKFAGGSGYEEIKDPETGEWTLTHSRVAAECDLHSVRYVGGKLVAGDLPAGDIVRHHVDFNKRNNCPDNLVRMLKSEHWQYHADVPSESRRAALAHLWKDSAYREKRSKIAKAQMLKQRENPEFMSRLTRAASVNMTQQMQDAEFRRKVIAAAKAKKGVKFSPQRLAKLQNSVASRKQDAAWMTMMRKRAASLLHTPQAKEKARQAARNRDSNYGVRHLTGKIENIRATMRGMGFDPAKQWDEGREALISQGRAPSTIPTGKYVASFNHFVVSVEKLPDATGPVYCLTVPGLHNFALSAGVFVHNCHGWWMHPELGELLYLLNNWGRGVHGKAMQSEIPGGFWITKPDAVRMIAQKECFAFDQLAGMAANSIDWTTV